MRDLFGVETDRKGPAQVETCGTCGSRIYHGGELHVCPPQAAARNTDPSTSFEAARKVERSGAADDQRAKCLEIVRLRPGLTAAEIADRTGLERHAPSRRLPELRRAGLVRDGEKRECTVMKSSAMTWWPLP